MSNGSTARTPFMAVLGSLSDTEKNRIIAVHFYANIPPREIDFGAAALAFGSASGASMSTMYGSTMRKARAEIAKTNGGTPPPITSATPNSKSKGTGGGRKRKAPQSTVTQDDDEEIMADESPSKGREKKKSKKGGVVGAKNVVKDEYNETSGLSGASDLSEGNGVVVKEEGDSAEGLIAAEGALEAANGTEMVDVSGEADDLA